MVRMSLYRPVTTVAFCICILTLSSIPATAAGPPDPSQCIVQYTMNDVVTYDPSGGMNTFFARPITMTLRDAAGVPITGLVATTPFEFDAWKDLTSPLQDLSDVFFVTTGMNDIPVSSLTEISPGVYRLAGPILAGKCPTGFFLRVQGVVINTVPIQITGRSPDVNGDLVVNLVDFADFATAFLNPGGYTGFCGCDLYVDGICNLADVALFAQYFGLAAPPGAIVDPTD